MDSFFTTKYGEQPITCFLARRRGALEQSKGKLDLGDPGSIGYCCCCSALNFMSLFFPDDLILR